jgi:hypothetical protein
MKLRTGARLNAIPQLNRLPRNDLLSNLVVRDGALVDKQGNEGYEVLYPTLTAGSYDPTDITWIEDNGHIGEEYWLTKTSPSQYDVAFTEPATYDYHFAGGNAIPTYCLIDFSGITGDNATAIKAIFNRSNDATITDGDNQAYAGYDLENPYRWSVETLLRQPEFIRSLQDNWHIFMKIRDDDRALERLVTYLSDNTFYVKEGTSATDKLNAFMTVSIDADSM